ncbi:DUF3558 family protein [Actinokineospora soli]|uniref:DUF3558 family protein n=1 Tax=Actinokineospora soli TaxID=1048753 RepID=A0ABW2TQB2_9PSEU
MERELDVRPWLNRICDLLTDAEGEAVGVDAPAKASTPSGLGASCSRPAGDNRASVNITASTRYEDVTELLLNNDHETQYMAEATTSGQPAVVVSEERDPEERCTVGVMLADDQSLVVDLRAGEGDRGDVCDRALKAADLAVGKVAEG